MPDQSRTLPFKVPELYGGFAEGRGLAKADSSELTLELVVRDSLVNVLKSGVKEVRIPRSEIDAVSFRRGWFGGRVQIRVKSLKWLANLPGCDNGEVTLHVARRDRDMAEGFVQMLSRTPA